MEDTAAPSKLNSRCYPVITFSTDTAHCFLKVHSPQQSACITVEEISFINLSPMLFLATTALTFVIAFFAQCL